VDDTLAAGNDLLGELRRHRKRVADERDRALLDAATDVLLTLISKLRLGAFLGTLVRDGKPRLLLRFRLRPGSPLALLGDHVVVKVYGDRPRGEGPLLQLWHRHGVPTPRLVYDEEGDCSWLALEHLSLAPVVAPSPTVRAVLTHQVSGWAEVLHRPAPALVPLLRPLGAVMVPRWDAAVAELVSCGVAVPAFWRARAVAAYRGESAARPLHGDLGLPNLGRDPAGRLIVYDASALAGPPAFDAARWCARLACAELDPRELMASWAAIEPLGSDVDALLATECVLEAGSRIIEAGQGDAAAPGGDELGVLLDAAISLLS